MPSFYSIRHLTQFLYESAVSESVMEVRMHPRTEGSQRCISFQLSVDPRARVNSYRDYLGNSVHHFDVPGQHRQLRILSESLVEVDQPPTLPTRLHPDAWRQLDSEIAEGDYWEMLEPSHYALPTEALRGLAKEFRCERRDDPLTLLRELNSDMYSWFAYAPKSTSVDSPIDDAIKAGEPDLAISLRKSLAALYRKGNRWQEVAETLELISAAEHERWNEKLAEEVADRNADDRFSRQAAELRAVREAGIADRLRVQNSRMWIATLVGTVSVLLIVTCGISWHLAVKRKGLKQLNHAHEEIREQKKMQLEMERHLARQQKVESLGLMASGIAHDFNNLLSGIAGLAELGKMSDLSVTKDDYFEQITSTSLRASGLTGQLLQFLGKPGSEKGTCDLSAVTLSVHALLQSLARPRRLVLNSLTDPNYAAVGETQFQQVLINLVSNAAEATPPDGEITVSFDQLKVTEPILDAIGTDIASTSGDYCRLIVRDNGKGLDVATRERLFDPYFSTKALGRGLGLSSVLGIVRSSGGFVRVESEAGLGSKFLIYFPVAEANSSQDSLPEPVKFVTPAEQEPAVVSMPLTTCQRSCGVLLVDDEVLLLRCISEYLEANGYTVFAADSATIALEMLKSHGNAIDCVVTDYSMPFSTGVWLAREIRKDNAKLPIILCSGFPEDNLASEQSVSALISKPFQPQQLLRLITRLLASNTEALDSKKTTEPLAVPAA